uniref:Uncharacterized protein n=1 Tax=Eutreptiella gymnastica TaxID=73025 RepID=A0A6U8H9S7_9EUGL
MPIDYDTIHISTDEEWKHHVKFTFQTRWMVVSFCKSLDEPLAAEFTKLASKFPSLTFAKVLIADMPLIDSLADAGIYWTLEPRYEIVIGGRCLSSQPNAKGTVIQGEHLLDGRLETILSTLVNQNYSVRKPATRVDPSSFLDNPTVPLTSTTLSATK